MEMRRYWKNKRVLVTGHEGFLGSCLTKALLENRAKVYGIDKVYFRRISILDYSDREKIVRIKGDVSNLKLVESLIKKYKPQTIFHLAAEAIVGSALKGPTKAFKSNIEGTWNILEASRGKKHIDSIVVASSDKAYGTHEKLPYTEDAALHGEYPYDVSKSCADLICQSYAHTYKVPVCITRCGNIYGPGDFHFSRIVPDAVICALKEKRLLIRSDGKYVRDYIYVDDIVFGYLILAEKMKRLKLAGESFNFSDEKPKKVIEIVKLVNKLADKKTIKPKILNKAKFEIKRQYLSSKKAKRILGWKPRYSLREGLIKTIDWYQNKF